MYQTEEMGFGPHVWRNSVRVCKWSPLSLTRRQMGVVANPTRRHLRVESCKLGSALPPRVSEFMLHTQAESGARFVLSATVSTRTASCTIGLVFRVHRVAL